MNAGLRPGVTESESAETGQLKKRVIELFRANEILRTALAFLRRSLTNPPRDNPIADTYPDRFGVGLMF